MAHKKPIRFTPRQLAGFTRGYSARLSAGGFGTVYGGALPNGLGVAVKVLCGGMGRRSEEQFMAEVGTIGRTHHINLVRLFGFCFDAAVRALVYEFMGDGALDAYLFDRTRAIGDSDGLRSPPSSSLWAEAAVSQNRRKPKSAAAATRRGGARGGSGRGRRGWR
ncbi:rust resistance kinase Lr10-like [Oryza glaberrima]|uniref:rust resistance kinase Lr10-like n=1 Tax=Oryza glaberrima TaxID=4538 RepID=UPI00224BE62A|nr:rust resistance kinase Lr10-like [Oryza glaberrima]